MAQLDCLTFRAEFCSLPAAIVDLDPRVSGVVSMLRLGRRAALLCLVVIVVAIAVPIAVVGGDKSEPNNYVAQSTSICGRSIPIDLSDTSTWATPSTPTLFQADYDRNTITLVKDDDAFGSIGIQLNAFFRAFDYSHDTRLPLYITQDNYFFRAGFFKLFMGGYNKDASFWERRTRWSGAPRRCAPLVRGHPVF